MATCPCTTQCSEEEKAALEKIGMQVLEEYLATFNSYDGLAWAKTLQYPHVRIAGDKVQVWNTIEEYVADSNLADLRKVANWGYTKWDWRRMIQADAEKMHFAVQFTRYTPEHEKIGSFESFYVITNANGRWGTQCRSSYVGIISGNKSF